MAGTSTSTGTVTPAGTRGTKRFRIVYRLEPDEGAPARAMIYAIAERASQRAYRLAERRWPRAE